MSIIWAMGEEKRILSQRLAAAGGQGLLSLYCKEGTYKKKQVSIERERFGVGEMCPRINQKIAFS